MDELRYSELQPAIRRQLDSIVGRRLDSHE
jgi:hypothetical protein